MGSRTRSTRREWLTSENLHCQCAGNDSLRDRHVNASRVPAFVPARVFAADGRGSDCSKYASVAVRATAPKLFTPETRPV
jgi:hypothetical protein